MTMPVFALLTPVALPQGGIGGQSALTDYSEGQQQSYSEDLAALLAGMETALSQLDSEMQQLSDGVAEELIDQGQVQSLSQSLTQTMAPLALFVSSEPVFVNATTSPLHTEVWTSTEAETPAEGALLSVSALSSSGNALSGLNPLSAAVLNQQNQSSALAAPLIASGTLSQHFASDAASVQNMLPQDQAELQDLWSALKPLQQNSQNTAASAGLFNLSQNSLLNTNLNNTAALHQTTNITDMLVPTAAVASAAGAAASTLPVWQADPLPVQSQHWGQRLVQMLSDKIDLQLGLNVNKAMIRLDPPSLGSIELSVQLDGDRLTVQMHSSNAQLRDAMGQGLEQLRASLQQKLGADVQIELRMGSDSSSQQQQQKTSQQQAQQLESNFHSEAEMTATESSQSNRLNLVNQLV
ncbi:flagellar hook-length control protein FliK [Rheinheimera faecalis]|uniref:flagellar hook-length control protein FliK n=1 Tax=Rheinheimera faecalis TaxID=2901141 RepID=UPI001E3D439D|nr:flagellar hook-length control protein FliK [Rheinheimera faecalis]